MLCTEPTAGPNIKPITKADAAGSSIARAKIERSDQQNEEYADRGGLCGGLPDVRDVRDWLGVSDRK